METSPSVVKRKRRRTRRCLDEIRKRSRRNANDSQSPLLNKCTRAAHYVGLKPNICITSNRLTLAMFPKVVRSETITRPIYSDIREENPSINFESIIESTKTAAPTECQVKDPSHSDSDYVKYSDEISSTCEHFSNVGQMSLQKDSDSGNLSTQENSPGSFLLFSPVDQREDSELFEESPETYSTPSSASSQSSENNFGYQLYEEIISEIPVYLKENTPALIKDDVMKRNKSLLHNIYLESCRRESEENILHCMRKNVVTNKCFSPRSPVIQSPLSYLRMSRAPRTRHVSDPPRTLYETPDYTYYPHKLNQ